MMGQIGVGKFILLNYLVFDFNLVIGEIFQVFKWGCYIICKVSLMQVGDVLIVDILGFLLYEDF